MTRVRNNSGKKNLTIYKYDAFAHDVGVRAT